MVQEVAERGLGPGADVEHLVGAGAGQVAAHDVAHRVAARLAGGQAHRRQVAQQIGEAFQLDEVHLDVLAGGEVAPAPAVRSQTWPKVELLGGRCDP